MFRRRVAILLGGFLLAAGSAPAQSGPSTCDAPVAAAELAVKNLLECQGRLTSFTQAATPVVASAKAEPETVARLVTYHAILAFDARDPGACSPLVALYKDRDCRIEYGEMQFLRARGGPAAKFAAECRNDEVAEALGLKKENIGAFCSALAQNAGNQVAACPKIAGLFHTPWPAGVCEVFLLDPLNPSACRGVKADEGSPMCTDGVAFAKASRARDIEVCGSSSRCRVLMGAGKQVAEKMSLELKSPLAQWFLKGEGATGKKAGAPNRNAYPGLVCATPISSPENQQALAGRFSSALSCLAKVEKADPSLAAAAGAKRKKLRALEAQVGRLFSGGKSTTAPGAR